MAFVASGLCVAGNIDWPVMVSEASHLGRELSPEARAEQNPDLRKRRLHSGLL